MFYLLEDKIKIYESSRSIGEINGKLFEAYHILPDKEDIACLGKIKKQSENVIELIEVGDLIIGSCKEVLIVRENLYDDKEILGLDSLVIGYEEITAIYKPNSRGDYIKVWEKK